MNPLELRERVKNLFRQYQAGDKDAMLSLFEVLRPSMFDYAFRMTGQRDASLKVFDEVATAMNGGDPSHYRDFEQFRLQVFTTLRSFGSHIWNSDTSQLVNEGYENFDYSQLEPGLSDLTVRRVETSLGALPAWEKEPLLLRARIGFGAEAIAEIMTSNVQGVQEGMNNAYIKIAQVCQLEPAAIDRAISCIPDHPLTGGTMHSTAALSQIMGDIEQSRSKFSVTKLVVSIVVLAGMAGLGWYIANNYKELIP